MSRRAGIPNGTGTELKHEKKPVEQRMDIRYRCWTMSNGRKHRINKLVYYHKMLGTSPCCGSFSKGVLPRQQQSLIACSALHMADYITELNGIVPFHLMPRKRRLTKLSGFCGVMSIFSSLRYCLNPDPTDFTNIWWALSLMPCGLFFDFMDGKVARWRKKSSLMGQELDSLADLVNLITSRG